MKNDDDGANIALD